MNNKITIRFQITHYQPIYTGAGKSLEKLINALDKTKFNLEIVTSYKKGLKRRESLNGLVIIRRGHGFFNSMGYLNSLGKLDFALSSAWFNLTHNNYDILKLIGVGNVSLPSIILAKILRKPIINKITAVGDDDPRKLSRTILGKLLVVFMNSNTIHWVISKELYVNCLESTNWKKENLYLITNPVELPFENIEVLRQKRLENRREEISFLFVGELNRRKGVHILIELWEREKIKNELILCGPIGEEMEIISKIENITNPSIKILGSLPKNDVYRLFMSCDYFLFPSSREGLPNVLLEGMSLGIPIVAFNIKGVTDFLLGESNERGIVLDDNRIDEWERTVKSILHNRIDFEKRTEAAFEWVKENSSQQIVAHKMEEIYKKLVS